jgi:hypothetical protein
VTLPKSLGSGARKQGRFGKQDFVCLPEEDAYRCPAGERLTYRYANVETGRGCPHPRTPCPACALTGAASIQRRVKTPSCGDAEQHGSVRSLR